MVRILTLTLKLHSGTVGSAQKRLQEGQTKHGITQFWVRGFVSVTTGYLTALTLLEGKPRRNQLYTLLSALYHSTHWTFVTLKPDCYITAVHKCSDVCLLLMEINNK